MFVPIAPRSLPLGMCGDSEIVGGVDNGADGVVNVGDEVTLAYTVTNTGNTCLGNVVVDDPSPGTLACSTDFSGMRGGDRKLSETVQIRDQHEQKLFITETLRGAPLEENSVCIARLFSIAIHTSVSTSTSRYSQITWPYLGRSSLCICS